jgi:MEMO1 family protein
MKKTIIILVIAFIIIFIISEQSNTPKCINNSAKEHQNLLVCKYFDETRFNMSLNTTSEGTLDKVEIMGGIVPHHLLADKMIAEFFKVASVKQPETVIIIGPNHTGAGVSKVHTGGWGWMTPFGILESDRGVTDYLVKTKIAETNFELMENEHSISAIVPYIKYFMPDAKIVPVLVSGTYTLKQSKELGESLEDLMKEKKCLFIASVDFSHYLSLEKANEMDEITRSALEDRNIQQINCMNNDFMDSPASIITLLAAMDEVKADNQKMLNHSNSAIIAENGYDYTTSYFTYIFY